MNQDLRHLARDAAPAGPEDGFRRLHALGLVGLRRAACIAGLLPATACTHCEAACPHGCIALGEDIPLIDPPACSGCGLCAAACPTGALAVDGVTLPTTVPAQGVVLICERSRAVIDAPVHRVACLGGLAVNDWLRLAIAAGDAAIRLVDDGACAACGNARAHESPWRAPLEIARRALSEAGMQAGHLPAAVSPDALPNGNPRDSAIGELPIESRRRFFAGLSRSLAAAVTRTATAGESLPTDVPVARRRRGGIAAQRGEETRVLLEHVARRAGHPHPRSALLPALTASAACRAHGACSRACPTGALHLETESDDGHARLQFDAWLCVDCGACAQICPSHALAHEERAWRVTDAPAVLATIEQSECARCGALFAAHEEDALCERCRKAENLARAGFALFNRHYRETPAAPEGP